MIESSEVKAELLDRGVVKFPRNVHGIYVDRQLSGNVVVTARQNDQQLTFVLDDEACQHLATLLLKEG